MKVYPENKKHDLCVISIENQFWSVFRWTQRSITQRRVITLGPIFKKMVLNWAQGLKKKSHEVSARKNNNRLRYNKKCRGGRIPHHPALLGLNCNTSPRIFDQYEVPYLVKVQYLDVT